MLSPEDLEALGLTFRLAGTVTLLLLMVCIPMAWWLARTSRRGIRVIVETVATLPLVLPPTVLGFYLLLMMGPNGPLGQLFLRLGFDPPVFNFTGLVIGSFFYSFPFVLQPLQTSFKAVGTLPLEAAATLGAGPIDRLLTVVFPLTRNGILTAGVMGFAHTLGEFGVVLMLGGNIPGQTRVASIAIFDHVEQLDYTNAHRLAGILVLLSFLFLLTVHLLNSPRRRPSP